MCSLLGVEVASDEGRDFLSEQPVERGAVDALFITGAAPAQFGREVDRLVDAGRIAGDRLRMAKNSYWMR